MKECGGKREELIGQSLGVQEDLGGRDMVEEPTKEHEKECSDRQEENRTEYLEGRDWLQFQMLRRCQEGEGLREKAIDF